MVRPRTQVGLGPSAVDAANELVSAAVSQNTSTVRETPDARADERSAEGKVIRFPAHRREDEAPLEPAPPETALAPMAQVPLATVPLAPYPQSEVKPTVREPLAGRTPNEGVRPAVVYGPSETVRMSPPAPVAAAPPQPAGSATLTSSHHDPPAPTSTRDVPATRSSLSRSSEDLFFKEGEEGRYEGGPSSIPPNTTLTAADPLHEPVAVQRTPEQEERRARFIRWVVLAMGFGIAISTMGIVLRKVAPPAATGDAPLVAPPTLQLPDPAPPVDVPQTAAPPPVLVPPPPTAPLAPEASAAPPPVAETKRLRSLSWRRPSSRRRPSPRNRPPRSSRRRSQPNRRSPPSLRRRSRPHRRHPQRRRPLQHRRHRSPKPPPLRLHQRPRRPQRRRRFRSTRTRLGFGVGGGRQIVSEPAMTG